MVSNMPVEAVYERTRLIGAELGYVVLPIWDWLRNSPDLPVGAINDNSSISTRTLVEQFFMIAPGQFMFQIRRQSLCNFLGALSCVG